MQKANLIVAVGNETEKGLPIGLNGSIPWYNKDDLKWFKKLTIGHPIIMGRKTWESLPHALPDRVNIVVTTHSVIDSSEDGNTIVRTAKSVEDALKLAEYISYAKPFIIGGASIYRYALEHNLVDKMYIDFLDIDVDDADTFFPIVNNNVWKIDSKEAVGDNAEGNVLTQIIEGHNNHADEQYLKLVKNIIKYGEIKDTRAGKTRSLFSKQMRFNLKQGLPMLTTKKVFSKGVIHELLWFIKGDTNIKYLVDNNVHIWDDDAYRYYIEICKKNDISPIEKDAFLKNVKGGVKFNDDYTYGDLNHVYGYQWTKWGGHNQIREVIETLKNNPDDRRMIISAWNVEDIPSMALPPCHFCCQFYTRKMTLEERCKWIEERRGVSIGENIELLDEWNVPTRKLSCVWHQRSCDFGLGIPFNMESYGILTHMIAQCANMDVDELIFDGGDCHVYENHINPLKEQLLRNPHTYALPTLHLNPKITNIDDFKYEDIKIEGYQSYPMIKMPLSVGL